MNALRRMTKQLHFKRQQPTLKSCQVSNFYFEKYFPMNLIDLCLNSLITQRLYLRINSVSSDNALRRVYHVYAPTQFYSELS